MCLGKTSKVVDRFGIVGRKHAMLASLFVHANHPAHIDLFTVDELVSVSKAYLVVFFGIIVVDCLVNTRFYITLVEGLWLWVLVILN